jgi:hypothetical protein
MSSIAVQKLAESEATPPLFKRLESLFEASAREPFLYSSKEDSKMGGMLRIG